MKNRIAWMLCVPALAVLLFGGTLVAQDKPATPPPAPKPGDTVNAPAAQPQQTKEQVIAAQKPSYPLDTCPISGHKLGEMGAPIDYVAAGRLVRLCCKDCVAEVNKTAGAVFAKIDAAVVAKEKASYPLTECPISGEKLGGMGEPVDHVNGTRLVRLCCKSCIKSVTKDPAAALAPINAAYIAAQKPAYKLATCPVGGEKLGDKAVDHLYGTRLVRFCCKDCIGEFTKEPEKFLVKLDAAAKTKQ